MLGDAQLGALYWGMLKLVLEHLGLRNTNFERKAEMTSNFIVKRIIICLLGVAAFTGVVRADLHLDPDTGKWIQDGYDISVFAQLPNGADVYHMAYGKGGSFGTDLYVTASGGKIYRIDSSGQASLFATLPTSVNGIDFPGSGSAFGDYVYVGSPDSYWGGNKNIYRIDSSGNVSVFLDGTGFMGGTANVIKFTPSGSPYGNYLLTHDDNPNAIYRITSDGSATMFSSNIPLAIDFMFDSYGQFDNKLIVANIEKNEHGSGVNALYEIDIDGTNTTLLNGGFHMGGGDITSPDSVFGGRICMVENYWPRQPTDLYLVDTDGSYQLFAQNFQFGDFSDVIYGPDGALYVGDDSGTIYQIVPEPASICLLAAGSGILAGRKHRRRDRGRVA